MGDKNKKVEKTSEEVTTEAPKVEVADTSVPETQEPKKGWDKFNEDIGNTGEFDKTDISDDELADIKKKTDNHMMLDDAVKKVVDVNALHNYAMPNADDSMPANKEAMGVDTVKLTAAINADTNLTKEEKATYLRAVQVIDKIHDNGKQLIRGTKSGKYWLEGKDGGPGMMYLGIVEVAEMLDNYVGVNPPAAKDDGAPAKDESSGDASDDVKALKIDPDELGEGEDFTFAEHDKFYLAAIGVDVASTAAAMAIKLGGYAAGTVTLGTGAVLGQGAGAAVSMGGGILSMGLDAWGDHINENVTPEQAWKNFGLRFGLEAIEAATFAPASIVAKFAKGAKYGRMVKRAISWGMAAGLAISSKDWLETLNKDATDWGVQDYRNLSAMVTFTMAAGTGSYSRYKDKKGMRAVRTGGTDYDVASTTKTKGKVTVGGKVQHKVIKKKVVSGVSGKKKIQADIDAEVKANTAKNKTLKDLEGKKAVAEVKAEANVQKIEGASRKNKIAQIEGKKGKADAAAIAEADAAKAVSMKNIKGDINKRIPTQPKPKATPKIKPKAKPGKQTEMDFGEKPKPKPKMKPKPTPKAKPKPAPAKPKKGEKGHQENLFTSENRDHAAKTLKEGKLKANRAASHKAKVDHNNKIKKTHGARVKKENSKAYKKEGYSDGRVKNEKAKIAGKANHDVKHANNQKKRKYVKTMGDNAQKKTGDINAQEKYMEKEYGSRASVEHSKGGKGGAKKRLVSLEASKKQVDKTMKRLESNPESAKNTANLKKLKAKQDGIKKSIDKTNAQLKGEGYSSGEKGYAAKVEDAVESTVKKLVSKVSTPVKKKFDQLARTAIGKKAKAGKKYIADSKVGQAVGGVTKPAGKLIGKGASAGYDVVRGGMERTINRTTSHTIRTGLYRTIEGKNQEKDQANHAKRWLMKNGFDPNKVDHLDNSQALAYKRFIEESGSVEKALARGKENNKKRADLKEKKAKKDGKKDKKKDEKKVEKKAIGGTFEYTKLMLVPKAQDGVKEESWWDRTKKWVSDAMPVRMDNTLKDPTIAAERMTAIMNEGRFGDARVYLARHADLFNGDDTRIYAEMINKAEKEKGTDVSRGKQSEEGSMEAKLAEKMKIKGDEPMVTKNKEWDFSGSPGKTLLAKTLFDGKMMLDKWNASGAVLEVNKNVNAFGANADKEYLNETVLSMNPDAAKYRRWAIQLGKDFTNPEILAEYRGAHGIGVDDVIAEADGDIAARRELYQKWISLKGIEDTDANFAHFLYANTDPDSEEMKNASNYAGALVSLNMGEAEKPYEKIGLPNTSVKEKRGYMDDVLKWFKPSDLLGWNNKPLKERYSIFRPEVAHDITPSVRGIQGYEQMMHQSGLVPKTGTTDQYADMMTKNKAFTRGLVAKNSLSLQNDATIKKAEEAARVVTSKNNTADVAGRNAYTAKIEAAGKQEAALNLKARTEKAATDQKKWGRVLNTGSRVAQSMHNTRIDNKMSGTLDHYSDWNNNYKEKHDKFVASGDQENADKLSKGFYDKTGENPFDLHDKVLDYKKRKLNTTDRGTIA